MTQDERLELLACIVMVPPMFWKDFMNGTHTVLTRSGIDERSYNSTLRDFAFKKRDYDRFRSFLDDCSVVFEEEYRKIENMSNSNINYVLNRVREVRVSQLIREYNF